MSPFDSTGETRGERRHAYVDAPPEARVSSIRLRVIEPGFESLATRKMRIALCLAILFALVGGLGLAYFSR